jgi:hypothetical protein
VRTLALDPMLRARLGRGAGDKITDQDMTWSRNARRVISLIKSHQCAKP